MNRHEHGWTPYIILLGEPIFPANYCFAEDWFAWRNHSDTGPSVLAAAAGEHLAINH
jgi:hypothetical protein